MIKCLILIQKYFLDIFLYLIIYDDFLRTIICLNNIRLIIFNLYLIYLIWNVILYNILEYCIFF